MTALRIGRAHPRAWSLDIIVQGFLQSESQHGVRYLQIIGDGDSSLLHRLRTDGPSYRSRITKVECANHLCKGVQVKINLTKMVKHFTYHYPKYDIFVIVFISHHNFITNSTNCSHQNRSVFTTLSNSIYLCFYSSLFRC